MSLNMINLILDVADGSGVPADRGSASLAPSVQLADTADNLLVVSPVHAVFTADGFPQARLIATDNPAVQPSGWGWTVAFRGVPGNPAGLSFFLPAGPQTFTATSANPCVFTGSAAGFPPGTGIQMSGGSLPGGFTAGTYYVVNAAGVTFGLAATPGGTPLASSSPGSGSAIAAQSYLSSLAPVAPVTAMQAYMPLPAGVAAAGDTVVATGPATWQWATPSMDIDGGSAAGGLAPAGAIDGGSA